MAVRWTKVGGGVHIQPWVLIESDVKDFFVFLGLSLLGLLHACFGPAERKVKPRPEYFAEVSPSAGGYEAFASRGFGFGDKFDLRVQIKMKDGVDFADIDLTFDCWLSAMKSIFGGSGYGTPGIVPLCDPLEVEPRLYGLEFFVPNRPDAGLTEFLLSSHDRKSLDFHYRGKHILTQEGHASGGISITKPRALTKLPVFTVMAHPPKGARGSFRSVYDAMSFAADDIFEIVVSINRK